MNPTPTPRHYWLIVARNGNSIASFDDPVYAKRQLHTWQENWQDLDYQIIEVQEVPNE